MHASIAMSSLVPADPPKVKEKKGRPKVFDDVNVLTAAIERHAPSTVAYGTLWIYDAFPEDATDVKKTSCS